MEKSFVLTLSVAIDLPEGATFGTSPSGASVITLPNGDTLMPSMAFKAYKPNSLIPKYVAKLADIEDYVGGMEDLACSLREMEDADLPTE